MAATEREREISFNICQKIGVIATYQTGWKKEVNLVEWNGGPVKVDIRDWDPSHTHMGKGITLYPEEADRLRWILYRYFTGKGAEKKSGSPEPAAAEDTDAAVAGDTEFAGAEAFVQDMLPPDEDLASVFPDADPETGEIQETPAPEEADTELQPQEEGF